MSFTRIRTENQLAPNIAELSAGTVGAAFSVIGLGELVLADAHKMFNATTFLAGVATAGIAQYLHYRRELAGQLRADTETVAEN
jgi:hypothetical protein